MNINFKGRPDGSTLATAIFVMSGISTPKFYRAVLPPDVDPLQAYSDIANAAWDYLSSKAAKEVQTDVAGPKRRGVLLQFQGTLTT